jgi:hypothetical protein
MVSSGRQIRIRLKSPGLALLAESVLTEELDACAKHEWGNEYTFLIKKKLMHPHQLLFYFLLQMKFPY